LSEASARLRLSETVDMIDAEMAIATAKVSLEDIGYDPESGSLDVDWASGRQSWSQTERKQKIIGIVETLETNKSGAPKDEVIETAVNAGIDKGQVEHEINKLKDNDIYEPNRNELRRL
jgi:replicative DNA helicase Mcm